MLTIDQIKQQFKQFESRLNGQKKHPLHQVRKAALEFVSQNGLPTSQDEEWRFTNPEPFFETQFRLAEKAAGEALSVEQIQPFLYNNFEGITLVFVNGYFMPHLSTMAESNDRVQISPLHHALSNKVELLPELNEKAVNEFNVFSALNAAFFSDGMVIEVPDHTVLQVPINVLNIAMGQGETVNNVIRNVIKVGEHSFLRVIETFLSFSDEPHFTNALTVVSVDKHAKVIHSHIQNENENAYHVGNVLVQQKQSSRYVSNNITLGGKLVRNNLKITLQGEFADAILNGFYMAHGTQHHDNHTLIEHASPNCTSNELYQGILADRASAVFAGKILVKRDAKKTDAVQSNNCLLLSDEAKIDTMPQLEIYADDVKCTHGATVGQLDEEAIFYLRTRGISENRAKNLLIYSFAERIIEQIKVKPVRDYVDQNILQRFKESMNFIK
ncbi:Fe-S cluster assembly protein SufD [Calditrichota bacterium LG25]